MRLGELFARAGLECPSEAENIIIKNIVTDSRRVKKGSLFICIKGLRRDGHEYIDNAIDAGAAVIVAERVRDACVGGAAAFIMLDNTRSVAALLYNAWYGNPTEKLKFIGVTGTNGKTSVSTMIYEIFTSAHIRAGLIGTVCQYSADGRVLSPKKTDPLANMTTPDPEELYRMLSVMVADDVRYVIMEVSSHALALGRVDAIYFDSAVFTNLTQDHLDFHGDMEEYYRTKRKLFNICRQAFINIDGEYGKRLKSEVECDAFTLSVDAGDFHALDVSSRGLGGSTYTLISPYGKTEINTPLLGSFGVINSLTAAAVAETYGISRDTIADALCSTKGVSGRMEKVNIGSDDISVIIDYAHTPDALEKLLISIRRIKSGDGHIILVFGCGGERDRAKRKYMAQIASRLADLVIVTEDNSRGEDPGQIIGDILKGIDKEKTYTVIKDRRSAIESAVLAAKDGDVIVLAGKGHERYEIDSKGRHSFDERKIVKTAIKKRYC